MNVVIAHLGNTTLPIHDLLFRVPYIENTFQDVGFVPMPLVLSKPNVFNRPDSIKRGARRYFLPLSNTGLRVD